MTYMYKAVLSSVYVVTSIYFSGTWLLLLYRVTSRVRLSCESSGFSSGRSCGFSGSFRYSANGLISIN